MCQKEQSSQEISPWTFRQQRIETILSSSKKLQLRQQHKSLPLRQVNHNIQPAVRGNQLKLPLVHNIVLLKNKEASKDSRMKELDNILNSFFSPSLPNYKLVSISFDSHSKQKKRSKKIETNHLKTLKQYTENHQMIRSQQFRHLLQTKEQKYRPKRFHTESKCKTLNTTPIFHDKGLALRLSKNDNKETHDDVGLGVTGCLHVPRKNTELRMKKTNSATTESSEITCGNLSLMKRTYNARKIKKILT